MVGDDKVNAEAAGQGGFLHGGDAVVHRDDEGVAFFRQRADGVGVEAVAAAVTAGQFAAHQRAEVLQAFEQDGGGRNAIDIVIAEDDDPLARINGLLDAGDGLVHIPYQERVGEFVPAIQQVGGRGGVLYAAGCQYPAEQRAVAGRTQGLFGRRVRRFCLPGTIEHRGFLSWCERCECSQVRYENGCRLCAAETVRSNHVHHRVRRHFNGFLRSARFLAAMAQSAPLQSQ